MGDRAFGGGSDTLEVRLDRVGETMIAACSTGPR